MALFVISFMFISTAVMLERIAWKSIYNENINVDTISESEYKQKFKDVMELYSNNYEYLSSVDEGSLKNTIEALKIEKYPTFFKKKHRKRMLVLLTNAERLMTEYLSKN